MNRPTNTALPPSRSIVSSVRVISTDSRNPCRLADPVGRLGVVPARAEAPSRISERGGVLSGDARAGHSPNTQRGAGPGAHAARRCLRLRFAQQLHCLRQSQGFAQLAGVGTDVQAADDDVQSGQHAAEESRRTVITSW